MTNTPLNDLFASATSEQKIRILQNEMTTPIEVIRGYAALIKKQVSGMDNQELVEYVKSIEKAAKRLKMLRNAIG